MDFNYEGTSQKKSGRRPIALQLAPLIDIFVLIIIFLIMGRVLSGVSIVPPKDLVPALSKSLEGMEVAPEVYVLKDRVEFRIVNAGISLNELRMLLTQDSERKLATMKEKIKSYVNTIPNRKRQSGTLVNLVADKDVRYQDVYEVTQILREAGFQNILFISETDHTKY